MSEVTCSYFCEKKKSSIRYIFKVDIRHIGFDLASAHIIKYLRNTRAEALNFISSFSIERSLFVQQLDKKSSTNNLGFHVAYFSLENQILFFGKYPQNQLPTLFSLHVQAKVDRAKLATAKQNRISALELFSIQYAQHFL